MKGNPKYKIGDKVSFKIKIKDTPIIKIGTIYIIDIYGTFENPNDVSYDILCENDEHLVSYRMPNSDEVHTKTCIGECLYKHVTESLINGKIEERTLI